MSLRDLILLQRAAIIPLFEGIFCCLQTMKTVSVVCKSDAVIMSFSVVIAMSTILVSVAEPKPETLCIHFHQLSLSSVQLLLILLYHCSTCVN